MDHRMFRFNVQRTPPGFRDVGPYISLFAPSLTAKKIIPVPSFVVPLYKNKKHVGLKRIHRPRYALPAPGRYTLSLSTQGVSYVVVGALAESSAVSHQAGKICSRQVLCVRLEMTRHVLACIFIRVFNRLARHGIADHRTTEDYQLSQWRLQHFRHRTLPPRNESPCHPRRDISQRA